jgi:uncharacterized membrane protein
MSNKLLITSLVAAVVAFILGYLIYGLALNSYFAGETAEGSMRADADMVWWAMILGHLVWGFFMTYVIGKWAGISTMGSGAKAGALIGLLVALSHNLINFAVQTTFTLNAALVDVVVMAVVGAITGAAIGIMMGRGKT